MAEASDFKFGSQLGFAKATIKPHPEEKWVGLGLWDLLKILGFPYNISVTAGASDVLPPITPLHAVLRVIVHPGLGTS